MRYVVSVMMLGMILALGAPAALAADCHGQGNEFRRRTPPPPPPKLQVPKTSREAGQLLPARRG
jgi:hypothetical protein